VQFGVWAQDLFECCIVDDEWSTLVLCHDPLTPCSPLDGRHTLEERVLQNECFGATDNIYGLAIARLGEPWDDALIRRRMHEWHLS
jgi:hypothetical protein